MATSAPAAKQSYQVGETAELNGLKITVNEAKESAGNQFIKPEAGKRFIIINVTVENTTDKDVSMSSVLQMELKDDTGRLTISIMARPLCLVGKAPMGILPLATKSADQSATKYQKRPRGSDGF